MLLLFFCFFLLLLWCVLVGLFLSLYIYRNTTNVVQTQAAMSQSFADPKYYYLLPIRYYDIQQSVWMLRLYTPCRRGAQQHTTHTRSAQHRVVVVDTRFTHSERLAETASSSQHAIQFSSSSSSRLLCRTHCKQLFNTNATAHT